MIAYSNITGPRWSNAAGTRIDVMVVFDHLGSEPVPFTAAIDDSEPHSVAIFLAARRGDYGPVAAFVPPFVPVPRITKRQALLWLLAHGKAEADVVAAIDGIAAAPVRDAARIEWTYPDGGFLHRAHPLFDQLGPALGITDMDQAFREAATL